MESTVLMSLSGAEFKAFLKEALTEILKGATKTGEQLPDILNINEASAFLKLKKTTLYEKTGGRLIPHFKRGNRVFFKRKELEQWLEQGKVKTLSELQSEAATFTMQHKK